MAREARVSTATVSRVLSNAPTGFRPETRDRVRLAIEALGYSPNASAAHLRTLRSGKLLVTAPDLGNPLYWGMLQGVEAAAQREGYAVLLGDTRGDPAREDRYASMLERRDADGWISLDHRLPHPVDRLVRSAPRGVPRLVCASDLGDNSGVMTVCVDNARAAADALAHLLQLGHRVIGVLAGPADHRISRERVRGTQQFAAARPDLRLIVVHGEFSFEGGAAGLAQLLTMDVPPSAVLCLNDAIATGALDVAYARGLHVPRDLSVMGFDDVNYACRTAPALSTVALPLRTIGETCVHRLLELVREPQCPSITTLSHAIIARASTGPRQM